MNELLSWLSQLFSAWKPWVVIPPWDIGVRVRLGSIATRLDPGPHLRVPFLDEITLVNTRLRVATTPQVTLAASAGRVRVVCVMVGYRVDDPLTAMMRFAVPDLAVLWSAQAQASQGEPAHECIALMNKEFAGTGIAIESVRFVEDVEVRAFRLLDGDWKLHSDYGSPPPQAASSRY